MLSKLVTIFGVVSFFASGLAYASLDEACEDSLDAAGEWVQPNEMGDSLPARRFSLILNLRHSATLIAEWPALSISKKVKNGFFATKEHLLKYLA